MEREFTYTKERLSFILSDILARDIRASPLYLTTDRAEEGFEKRAALEFLLWFLDQAFPEHFSFACKYERLDEDYPAATAEQNATGPGWSARRAGESERSGNVILVDFRKRKK